jgi:hypothetical protein
MKFSAHLAAWEFCFSAARESRRTMISYQKPHSHQHTEAVNYRIDLWVSRHQLAEMLAWRHRELAPGTWKHHRHSEPLLGKGAVVARFYFSNENDARAFGEAVAGQGGPPRSTHH